MGRGPRRRRYRRHEAHLFNRWRRRLTLHSDHSFSTPHSSSTPRSKPTARSGRGHARLCNCQRSPSPRLCRVCLATSSLLGLYIVPFLMVYGEMNNILLYIPDAPVVLCDGAWETGRTPCIHPGSAPLPTFFDFIPSRATFAYPSQRVY